MERKIKEGFIDVREVEVNEEVLDLGLGPGESEALSLAKILECDLLADDESAREAARMFRIAPRGSLYFLAEGLKKIELNFDECLECLEELTEVGFYMDDGIYIEAVRRGRKIVKKDG